ncbi:MAG: pilus assembly protein TadG-related protein [Ilumatobacteraceae bacterium]
MTAVERRRSVDLRDDRGSVTVWAISATVASVLIIGLVIDGGTMLRARSDAFALASSAARAGAQELDSSAAVQGLTMLDPAAAERAALEYLAAHGATGTVAITDETITVTVTSATSLQLLRLAGAETASFTATSTVNIVKVELP